MESEPQNPEFKNNPENFRPCSLPYKLNHKQQQMKNLFINLWHILIMMK